MADRPILFSGPMVRALLAGTKTQTRRIINPQPKLSPHHEPVRAVPRAGRGWVWMVRTDSPSYQFATGGWKAPYAVGDRLYVREHWRCDATLDAIAPRNLKSGLRPIWFEAGFFGVTRNGTPLGPLHPADLDGQHIKGKFRQGMHMPRWASRLTLTVTDVRVERLQDISEADALAEGVKPWPFGDNLDMAGLGSIPAERVPAKTLYCYLWDHINGPCAWEANPWVAAYTFTVQMGNIDQLAQAA